MSKNIVKGLFGAAFVAAFALMGCGGGHHDNGHGNFSIGYHDHYAYGLYGCDVVGGCICDYADGCYFTWNGGGYVIIVPGSGGSSAGSTSGYSSSGSTSGYSSSGSTSGYSSSGSTSGYSSSGSTSGYSSSGSTSGSYGSNGSYGALTCANVGACESAASAADFAKAAKIAASQTVANAVTDSNASDTKDTDLQQAEIQQQDLNNRASSVSNQFGMSFDSAVQLTKLADTVQSLSAKGAMTSEDRDAITQSALGVAGISTEQVNAAIANTINGDKNAMDSLMQQAAQNLGMPSSAGLRDQLLPALGINL